MDICHMFYITFGLIEIPVNPTTHSMLQSALNI